MSIPEIIAVLSGLAGVISAIGALFLLEYRMKKVEEKLDEHNGYAEKLNSIEKSIVAIQKDIEYIKLK